MRTRKEVLVPQLVRTDAIRIHNPTVVMPSLRPATLDPRIVKQEPTLISHFLAAIKKRARMRIDGTTARIGLPTLRTMTEQAKLATEFQSALNALGLAELEREVKIAELEHRKLELTSKRRQFEELESLRIRKERLTLMAEVAALQRQIREQKQEKKPQPTQAQQQAAKKAEIEQQLQRLRTEEAKALQRTASELEKRRVQNMCANRRDRLMTELEKYL